jgi:hypothetical protein
MAEPRKPTAGGKPEGEALKQPARSPATAATPPAPAVDRTSPSPKRARKRRPRFVL